MVRARLSVAEARRIALAAQGFADAVPTGPATLAHLRRVVGRTKLFQMDSVNIAARAHYMPLFSRLGPYDPALLDRAAWATGGRRPRLLVEYWAHEAALIPLADWPLFGWRMAEFRDGRYRYTREVMQANRHLADDIVGVITDAGASTPRQIEAHLGIEREPGTAGSWWQRGEVKHVCEAMFASGQLSAVRDSAFARHYDLTERVIGTEVTDIVIDVEEAHRQLTARAASALGIATLADLADYYRLRTAQVRPALDDLVDEGVVRAVTVDGWREAAYISAEAKIPRRIDRTAILSPFDPVVFFRPRVLRLFDFHYRIEIYVPAHKRVHGYYVLPYLMGDDICARVDLKADRKAGVLHVVAAHLEAGRDAAEVSAHLADDLTSMAQWLGLSGVSVHRRGDLSGELQRHSA